MRFLFFFVHPSKFHVFRNTINHLKEHGHKVDIVITSKDVLADLVEQEGWGYVNIFPEGRKMKGINPLISSGINFFITIYRLLKFTSGKKYDLFITDDLLVYVGKWKNVPTFVINDDDLSIVKQYALVLSKADHILAPDVTQLGKYSSKMIGFPGYKELAYLHPNHFKPDVSIIKTFNPELKPYFILRLVSLRAYHDVGRQGLSDLQVKKLINLLETKGKVFISAERKLPSEFERYKLDINPMHISHALYYAQLFIGDSQTMTSEAAVLGTPAFRCNDFAGKISVMEEKEEKYGLSFNYPPARFNEMFENIASMINVPDFKNDFIDKRKKMLQEKIDLSLFMIWLFENYPGCIDQFRSKEFTFEPFKFNETKIFQTQ